MFDVYVINLERRADRKTAFLAWNSIEGVRFSFVPAVDGRTLVLQELVSAGMVAEETRYYTYGQLGCALSHRNLWLKCLELEANIVVCEDDAVLRRDFASRCTACVRTLPEGWDICLLGYNFDSVLKVELIPGIEHLRGRFANERLDRAALRVFQHTTTPGTVLRLLNAFGTPGYVLSPKGAKSLLSRCFPLSNVAIQVPVADRTVASRSIDGMMNSVYEGMTAYALFPPVVVSPNEQDPSNQASGT